MEDPDWLTFTLIGWLLLVWVGVRAVRSALKAEAEEAKEVERNDPP